MKYILLFFLLVFHANVVLAIENVQFDILLFGSKIGQMSITREAKEDGIEEYILETNSRAKILWVSKENYTRYEVQYRNGKLINSKQKEIENGQVKRWTNVRFDGNKYIVDSYKGSRTFTEIPQFSIVTIFFKDISSVKRIFYEAEADFNDLKPGKEPDTWEFTSSDGHRNVYRFRQGKIYATEFHTTFATVKMIRTR